MVPGTNAQKRDSYFRLLQASQSPIHKQIHVSAQTAHVGFSNTPSRLLIISKISEITTLFIIEKCLIVATGGNAPYTQSSAGRESA